MAAFGGSCRDSGHGFLSLLDPLRTSRVHRSRSERAVPEGTTHNPGSQQIGSTFFARHVSMKAVSGVGMSDEVLKLLASKGGVVGIHGGAAVVGKRFREWTAEHPAEVRKANDALPNMVGYQPSQPRLAGDHGEYIEMFDRCHQDSWCRPCRHWSRHGGRPQRRAARRRRLRRHPRGAKEDHDSGQRHQNLRRELVPRIRFCQSLRGRTP
jgi:hypothetical protein